jgi:hypothetical protein
MLLFTGRIDMESDPSGGGYNVSYAVDSAALEVKELLKDRLMEEDTMIGLCAAVLASIMKVREKRGVTTVTEVRQIFDVKLEKCLATFQYAEDIPPPTFNSKKN